MDIFLAFLGFGLIVFGILGCILPVIPGPPLSFLGLIALHYTKYAQFSSDFLFLFGALAVIVTILDYIVPIWGTKKFGGSKAGAWGATIGLIIGIFFSPFSAFLSIILGPLFGAIIGELITGKEFNAALKSGLGSLLGFLLGVGMKLAVSGVMTYHFFKELLI